MKGKEREKKNVRKKGKPSKLMKKVGTGLKGKPPKENPKLSRRITK